MHALLTRQIARHLPPGADCDPAWAAFFRAIDESYTSTDEEDRLRNRAMDLMSEELTARYAALQRELDGRKEIEARLMARESQWVSLLDALPQVILFLGPDSRIRWFNRPATFAAPVAIGAHVLDIMPVDSRGNMHVGLQGMWQLCLPHDHRMRLSRAGESDAVWDLHLRPVVVGNSVTGAIFSATDISEHARFTDAIEASEKQMRSMFDNSPVGICAVDDSARILHCNAMLAQMLGRTPHELIGRPFLDLARTDGRATLEWRMQQLAAGSTELGHDQVPLASASGSEIWVKSTIVRVDDSLGNPLLTYAMFEDITERRAAGDRQKAMEIQLRQAQKLEAIGQLASGIAHEINTPTQFIGDNVHFLERAFAILAAPLEAARDACAGNSGAAVLVPATVIGGLRDPKVDKALAQIPAALAQTRDGVHRVSEIVRAMKEFAHPSGRVPRKTGMSFALRMR